MSEAVSVAIYLTALRRAENPLRSPQHVTGSLGSLPDVTGSSEAQRLIQVNASDGAH